MYTIILESFTRTYQLHSVLYLQHSLERWRAFQTKETRVKDVKSSGYDYLKCNKHSPLSHFYFRLQNMEIQFVANNRYS